MIIMFTFRFDNAVETLKFLILLQEFDIQYSVRYCAYRYKISVNTTRKICDCLLNILDCTKCVVEYQSNVIQFKFENLKTANSFFYLIKNILRLPNIQRDGYTVKIVGSDVRLLHIIEALGWEEKVL